MLVFALLFWCILLGAVMQGTSTVGPDKIEELGEVIAPYVMGVMLAGIAAGFICERLWRRLQPVVRARAFA
jgi:hypothetical protein